MRCRLQPRKVEQSGLFDAVEKNVLIYIHKNKSWTMSSGGIQRTLCAGGRQAAHPDSGQADLGFRVTTIFPRQGHYAHDPEVLTSYPPADIGIERIGDCSIMNSQSCRQEELNAKGEWVMSTITTVNPTETQPLRPGDPCIMVIFGGSGT